MYRYVKSVLSAALLASSTATAFNGPAPNALLTPKHHPKTALNMAGGAAPALKVHYSEKFVQPASVPMHIFIHF